MIKQIKLPVTKDDYKLLGDSYTGSGGFLDGTYITAHKRETEKNYVTRKELAYYLNYVDVVVDSHVKAIFSKEAIREFNGNKYYEAFVKDADANGTSLNRFMKQAATKAKLYGCVFVVVDNFRDADGGSVKSALEMRRFPYLYTVIPSMIVDYKKDAIGRLKSIIYSNTIDINGQDTDVYVKINDEQIITVTTQGDIVDIVDHGLGMLPVVVLYGVDHESGEILPVPKFIQPARANKAIYNICSEIREIERKQTFSILTIQGERPERPDVVGTESAIYYPETCTNGPAFITPETGPLDKLQEDKKSLIEEIFRMSCVTFTQSYATNQSGESKKWSFHITEQVLEDFAVSCEQAENNIGKLFGAYINTDIGLNVVYNKKYGIEDAKEFLEEALLALEVNFGTDGNAMVRAKAARAYFADASDEEINTVIDTIEKEKDMQKSINEPYNNVADNSNVDDSNDDNGDLE